MKKFPFLKTDRVYFKIALYTFAALAASILFEKVVGNLPSIGGAIAHGIAFVRTMFWPFFLGFMFAYVVNPFLNFFETRALSRWNFCKKHPKSVRLVCILLIYTVIIGGIIWIVIYLIPEIKASVLTFTSQLPIYTATLNRKIDELFQGITYINGKNVNQVINRLLESLTVASHDIPKLAETILGNVFYMGRAALNTIMGIFISFYMLYDKEDFGKHLCKIALTILPQKTAKNCFYNAKRIHRIFQSFIVGKAVDSLIIGILAFIGLSLIGAPLTLVLSLIIGVTNMIPYFGPFLGGIPSVVITLLISPIDAIWVGIFILALQQFDGNFLGPKILGNSLEISPLWIILAVVVGGMLMGPMGMFVGVPVFATIKMFCTEYIEKRYAKKYGTQTEDILSIITATKENNSPE